MQCNDRPEPNPCRRQAMMLQRQVMEEQNWRSMFSDSKNHLSAITLDEIRPADVVILLLGKTGTGRSTFISMFDTQNRPWVNDMINQDMESKTRDVKPIRVSIPNAHGDLVLLDTPGFDSSAMKDMETLKIISDALKDRSGRCIRVNGVIYFDPIERANEKFQQKLLQIALNICGEDNYDRMAFLSTNWDTVESRTKGEQNEKALTEGAWKSVLTCNSSTADLTRVGRFVLDEGKDAVRKLTWALVRQCHVRIWLQLQLEMSQGAGVEETQAGKGILRPVEAGNQDSQVNHIIHL
ncbi:hypothetical protein BJ165DRAFT_1447711 [Panaeolus papilionaceus]|nr:hypothetical protein BJ165DRAFT_1447711 [Panaeolus papilionaceus]